MEIEKAMKGMRWVLGGAKRVEPLGKYLATMMALVGATFAWHQFQQASIAERSHDEHMRSQLMAFQRTASAMAANTLELVSQTASMQEYAHQTKRQADILHAKIELEMLIKDKQALSAASAALKAQRYELGRIISRKEILDAWKVWSGAYSTEHLIAWHEGLLSLCGVATTQWQNLDVAANEVWFAGEQREARVLWHDRYKSIAAVWPVRLLLDGSNAQQVRFMANTLSGAERVVQTWLDLDVANLERRQAQLEVRMAEVKTAMESYENPRGQGK